jgi:hypothetical protein
VALFTCDAGHPMVQIPEDMAAARHARGLIGQDTDPLTGKATAAWVEAARVRSAVAAELVAALTARGLPSVAALALVGSMNSVEIVRALLTLPVQPQTPSGA